VSDVATVAAITGGTSVMTSAITAAVTWVVSKNSASVELAKVEAENGRLLIDVVVDFFQAVGVRRTEDEINALRARYKHLMSGVVLFGPRPVRDGAYALNRVANRVWPALANERAENPQKPFPEQWRDATADLESDLGDAIVELTDLMHADVTRGIADQPDD